MGICVHGLEEHDGVSADPACAECECAPFLTDDDVAPLRALLNKLDTSRKGLLDLLAVEIVRARRAEDTIQRHSDGHAYGA